jgi:hypothetical protein
MKKLEEDQRQRRLAEKVLQEQRRKDKEAQVC